MKKALFLAVVFCLFAGAISAQQIKASPVEGRWAWDKRGDTPEFFELIFFGNVSLLMEDEGDEYYEGDTFTCTNNTINIGDGDFLWRYRISGSTLTITDEDGDTFTYRKAAGSKSPIEGLWEGTGGTLLEQGEVTFWLFTGNVLAIGDEFGFEGITISYRGKSIMVEGESVEYKVSGNSLTLAFDEGTLILRKKF